MDPWFRTAVIVALVLSWCLLSPVRAAAQQASTPPASGRSRVAWTLIGAGIGFGGGLIAGLRAFDDAVHAERKIVTTSIVGAGVGGLAGGLLSRRSATRAASRPDTASDPLWNSMLLGAAAGAGVGLWYAPKAHCETDINPECPGVLRAAVGIPAVAGGAALGALVDRLVPPSPAPAPREKVPAMSISPVIGRKTVGVRFARTF